MADLTKTQRIQLRKVRLLDNSKEVVIPSATLLLHQEYISDGLGGHLKGMRSWEIQVLDGVPAELLLSGNTVSFQSGKYSGKCFAVNNTTIKGTGPISGISET